jgi:anti-sigma factor ChrR (cupin superfamily)
MTTIKACERTRGIAEYALRALSPSETVAFDAHLSECGECRDEMQALAPILDALVDWPTDVLRPPSPLWARLARRIANTPTDDVTESRWEDEPAWQTVKPGLRYKLLSKDEETERVSMLVQLDPGVDYPPHTHAGLEELHLLDGELWIDDHKLVPGDYNRAEVGTSDQRVWSETGCTCVLVTSHADVITS